MRQIEEEARRAADDYPAWSDSAPMHEVLDVANDAAVAPVSTASAPVPFWHQPSQRVALTETPAPLSVTQTEPTNEGPEEGETLPSFDNAYAVKLALAHEAAAVDLWDEARELLHEVLETDDPTLQAQAHTLLATIAQREHESHGGL